MGNGTTNDTMVRWALDVLQHHLRPYVERQLRHVYGDEDWQAVLARTMQERRRWRANERISVGSLDVQGLFDVMTALWKEAFSVPTGNLSRGHRGLISELWEVRKNYAHQ